MDFKRHGATLRPNDSLNTIHLRSADGAEPGPGRPSLSRAPRSWQIVAITTPQSASMSRQRAEKAGLIDLLLAARGVALSVSIAAWLMLSDEQPRGVEVADCKAYEALINLPECAPDDAPASFNATQARHKGSATEVRQRMREIVTTRISYAHPLFERCHRVAWSRRCRGYRQRIGWPDPIREPSPTHGYLRLVPYTALRGGTGASEGACREGALCLRLSMIGSVASESKSLFRDMAG
jgi:hypothetical protein